MSTHALLPGMEGESRCLALSQWYTPPALAERVWAWACRHEIPRTIIEPAAGHGALLKAAFASATPPRFVFACDIDPRNVSKLRELTKPDATSLLEIALKDFLIDHIVATSADLVLQNPPYEPTKEHIYGQDVAFILRALELAQRTVGIFRSAIQHGQGRKSVLWSRVRITRGVRLAARPDFGGDGTAKSDFVVLELVKRDRPLEPGEVDAEQWEVW